jgi:PhnB protein
MATFAEFHASSDPSEDDLIMHADLQAPGGLRLMAADAPNHMEYDPGNNVSMSLSGESEPELRGYYDKLADGGSVGMPLDMAPWGDMFGMCTDRFGIRWLVNVSMPKD